MCVPDERGYSAASRWRPDALSSRRRRRGGGAFDSAIDAFAPARVLAGAAEARAQARGRASCPTGLGLGWIFCSSASGLDGVNVLVYTVVWPHRARRSVGPCVGRTSCRSRRPASREVRDGGLGTNLFEQRARREGSAGAGHSYPYALRTVIRIGHCPGPAQVYML